MNLVVNGMAEGFAITDGLGDPGAEPPPTPPAEGVESVVLGSKRGGAYESTTPDTGLFELSESSAKKEISNV